VKRESTKIDKEFYNSSSYFDQEKKIFTNLNNPLQKYRISKVLQIYTPNKSQKVLDLGCGWGTFCFALAPLCKEITGLDISKKSIKLCQKLLTQYKKYNNVKFICRDASNTKLDSDSYDVIICADLIEHLYPKVFEKVLDESRRVLRKGGKLIIWTPHGGHFLEILKNHNIILKKDISHVDYKSMKQISEALIQRGFLIKKNYYTESHIPLLRNLERILLHFFPIMRRRIAILAIKN